MSETLPIYFSVLEIENVRCFGGRQVLDLTVDGRAAQWTLLIGENGAGKTTLLECLAWMRPLPKNPQSQAEPNRSQGFVPLTNGMLEPALSREDDDVLETLPRLGAHEVKLSADFCSDLGVSGMENAVNQKSGFGIGVKLNYDQQRLLLAFKPKNAQIKRLRNPFHDPLLIVSYGANRYLGERNSLDVDEPDSWDHERLSQGTELYDAEEILMSLDYATATNPNGRESFRLRLLKETIAKILPENLESEAIKIYPPDVLELGRPSGVYVKTSIGLVRMSALSLGYRTTAGWVMDLAWRFLKRYPDSQNPLAEPAIVLIDEIDLHLHPRWQRGIIEDLGALFPATQFIATSHSPLIVQAAESANLVLLQKQKDNVSIVNNPSVSRDLRVDQILTSLIFGVPSPRSERIDRLYFERAELVDKTERSPEQESRLNELRQQIDDLPTAEGGSDQVAIDIVRRFAARLQDREANRS